MNNSHTEFTHQKRSRDENSASLSSPEQNTDKKRKKNKNKVQDALVPQDPLPTTQPNEKGDEHLQLRPNPNPVTLEKEQGAELNGVTAEHSVSGSPEQNTNKKRKKNKNKVQDALVPQDPLPTSQPNEKGDEHLQLCPNPNPVTLEKEQGAEPNGVTAEHSVSGSPEQNTNKKRKKTKNEVLAFFEGKQPTLLQLESELRNRKEKGAESCEVKVTAVQHQVCHNHDLANPVVQEKRNLVELKETSVEQPQLCNKQKHEFVNEVVETRKDGGVLPEIPVQRSIGPIESSQTEQKLSIESATPIDQEQKKQEKKKSEQIPVSEDNVEQPANAPLQRSEQHKGNEPLFHGRCMACRELGHKVKNCPTAEICFFCGEFDHTLAKCSVFQAGGRFAWCLFCFSHGHFTNKCPQWSWN